MKLRYKKHPEEIRHASNFNITALAEVDMQDDSAEFYELDAFLEATGQWKDFRQALADHDIITNNHNTCFFEPVNEEERKRGYRL